MPLVGIKLLVECFLRLVCINDHRRVDKDDLLVSYFFVELSNANSCYTN